ncbi:germ cell-specific gene 1-like protein [Clarias gariepinus]|uniref:germ cell-specific gene 1-like protein n=1 Tax=Clarias gariepinus TaxID=13013 RepID=UPI00234D2F77|nr:germ cell-specific gene 1-like protein [Clarias gariepinus]
MSCSSLQSPRLSFLQTLFSLFLSFISLFASNWCSGVEKVPKPLCSLLRRRTCTPSDLFTNGSAQFTWETGDDRFIFPSFHAGIWSCCEENIHKDEWEENCRNFIALTPPSEKGIFWLCVLLELMYISLLCISCVLLMVQLAFSEWKPSLHQWGELLNAYAAVFTVLGGLVGMVGHIMFMQVFQVTASSGPEDFKPHRYGYSWAFYMAWVAFTCCMIAGVSTLNNYTKKVLMIGTKPKPDFHTSMSLYYPPVPPPPSCPPPPPPLSPHLCPPSPSPMVPHAPPSPTNSAPCLSSSPSVSVLHSPHCPSPPLSPAPSITLSIAPSIHTLACSPSLPFDEEYSFL